MNDRHPNDPRNHPRHREHGPHRGSYTYEDIAKITGLGVATVRAYGSGKRRRFTLRDFASVVRFVAERTQKGAQR